VRIEGQRSRNILVHDQVLDQVQDQDENVIDQALIKMKRQADKLAQTSIELSECKLQMALQAGEIKRLREQLQQRDHQIELLKKGLKQRITLTLIKFDKHKLFLSFFLKFSFFKHITIQQT
jgi:histidinol dehydrogenase